MENGVIRQGLTFSRGVSIVEIASAKLPRHAFSRFSLSFLFLLMA